MAQYTIEDIEILRQKSGISYEEAVNLLEYHNGSLARALVDLEKNGKLNTGKSGQKAEGKHRNFFTLLYRIRLKVSKGSVPIVNLSVLFLLVLALLGQWWALVLGLIASLVLGYRITVDRNSPEMDGASFEDMVKNAAGNVRATVSSIARDIGGTQEKSKQPEGDSFYQRPADAPRADSAASGTTPVNVQFPGEGDVEVRDDSEGFHQADVK